MHVAQINHDIGREYVGYVVNTGLDEQATARVEHLQDTLAARLVDAVWLAPPEALHITLLDLLAPLVDYGRDKDELFKELRSGYDRALRTAMEGVSKIPVHFGAAQVSESAVYFVGQDHGEFATIRERFLQSADLLPGTKQPPQIVHFTAARFRRTMPLSLVEDVVREADTSFDAQVTGFRLVRETRCPMLEYEPVTSYNLFTGGK
jgi:2'-5' RNA ligase